MKKEIRQVVTIGGSNVTLEQIIAVAAGEARVKVSSDRQFLAKMQRSQNMLYAAISKEIPVYGVTTGYGKSCGKRLSKDHVMTKNGSSPLRFHGCGTGEPIGVEATRAAMLCRMICLAMGYSGVSVNLLKQMAALLNHGITPVVPCEGSVGASGDLTPMSYVAAALAGQRDVVYAGKRMPAAAALRKTKLMPYSFGPKEAISMMNGTSTMTGIAAVTVDRAYRLLDAAICATALTVHALKGKVQHFHPVIGEAKPFPGQIDVARKLTALLQAKASPADLETNTLETLQDPYSIRCTPQIAGVLHDALLWVKPWVETEANSANDNPIFDPDTGQPLMCGNFYGGHIAFAMDALKAALASVADMSDRQVALLVDPLLNRGLPADLVGARKEEVPYHHGFKAMSLATSALAAEALKNTMPAASFSRSTESHNQDKVSMGTIAARDAERICTLAERVMAIHLLAAAQGCEIRKNVHVRPRLAALIKDIRSLSKAIIEDREMDQDIEKVAWVIRNTHLFRLAHEA